MRRHRDRTLFLITVKNFCCKSLTIMTLALIVSSILRCSMEEHLYKPQNVPVVNAGNDTTVSINDTIIRDIIATDNDGSIEKMEWKINNGIWNSLSSEQIILIAPEIQVTFICSVKVTDNDGFLSQDEFIVTIIIDKPVCTASNTTPTVSINDTIRLQGTAADEYGRIVKWEWDVGNTGTFVDIAPDSCYVGVACSTANSSYLCLLKVTDDDGNVVCDTVSVNEPRGKFCS